VYIFISIIVSNYVRNVMINLFHIKTIIPIESWRHWRIISWYCWH